MVRKKAHARPAARQSTGREQPIYSPRLRSKQSTTSDSEHACSSQLDRKKKSEEAYTSQPGQNLTSEPIQDKSPDEANASKPAHSITSEQACTSPSGGKVNYKLLKFY